MGDGVVVIGVFGVIGRAFGHRLILGHFDNRGAAGQKIIDRLKLVHDGFGRHGQLQIALNRDLRLIKGGDLCGQDRVHPVQRRPKV